MVQNIRKTKQKTSAMGTKKREKKRNILKKAEEAEEDPKISAQLRDCKYVIVHIIVCSRITASPAVQSVRSPRQRYTIGRIAPFESCRSAMEV